MPTSLVCRKGNVSSFNLFQPDQLEGYFLPRQILSVQFNVYSYELLDIPKVVSESCDSVGLSECH